MKICKTLCSFCVLFLVIGNFESWAEYTENAVKKEEQKFIDQSRQRKNAYSIEDIRKKIQRIGIIDEQERKIRTPLPMTVPETIRFWGYPCEEISVTTADGYILGIHRIPPITNNGVENKVVLLWHGLTGSSSNFAFGPPEQSLAYILHDYGFDVWMGNTRGNTYSKKHETLSSCGEYNDTCRTFWDFGSDDAAVNDYPAVIDYILEATGKQTIYFVGHSQGTTLFFALHSEIPDYNNKIEAAVLMSPMAYLGGTTNNTHYNPLIESFLEKKIHEIVGYEFAKHRAIESLLGRWFCAEESKFHDECIYLAQTFLDFNWDQINETMIPQYLDHFPAGSSTRPFFHYLQLRRGETFHKFDFGKLENPHHYDGSRVPPVYDLTKISVPTTLLAADADMFVTLGDVNRIAAELQNLTLLHLVDYEGFQHQDFVLAMNANEKVYKYVLEAFGETWTTGKRDRERLPN